MGVPTWYYQSKTEPIATHPNHWHAPWISSYRVDGDGPLEYDVEDYVCQYHAEALTVFGREDSYYVYDCEDPACFDEAVDLEPDDEWWTPANCARRWGRND